MTSREFYSGLIRMHPPEFRENFGGQMMLDFDDMTRDGLVRMGLFADAMASISRQWLLRSGIWKAGVSLSLSALLFAAFPRIPGRVRQWMIPAGETAPIAPEMFALIALLTLVMIFVVLIAVVIWSRQLNRLRSSSCRWNSARSRSGIAG
jgi:hypothetical protein